MNHEKSIPTTTNHEPWMIEAYNYGVTTQGMDAETVVYSDLVPNWVFTDHSAYMFYIAGYNGFGLPRYVTGWRYGDIPDGGRSYNFAESRAESGLSVMQLDGEAKTKSLVEFTVVATRPVVRVGGWLIEHDTGGDGEPLLIEATKL